MQIRATLRVRNAKMLEARESVGLTQKNVAEACGVPLWCVGDMESMNFANQRVRESVAAVAGFLDIPASDIMPEELAGVDSCMDAVRTCDIEPSRLVAIAHTKRIELANDIDPTDELSRKTVVNDLMRCLTERERSIVKCRFYGGLTLAETGKIHGVTQERIRNLESRAIRKLQHAAETRGLVDSDIL